jgi:hypothetical protein
MIFFPNAKIVFFTGRREYFSALYLKGVTILHETIHKLHRKKLNGVILKVDFEKAYDKVKWTFLQQTLRMKGFPPLWCMWIHQFVSGGSVAVKVNNDVGRYFQTKKGLHQGDLLSPILFNLVADMLAIFITRAKEDGQIQGLIPHLVEDGLSILQYADDTILFLEHDLEQAKNLKIICAFEQLSGLKKTSTRVNCFVMERQRIIWTNTHKFFDVKWDIFLSGSCVFP